MRLSYLGPDFSFSHFAAMQHRAEASLGPDVELNPVPDFQKLLKSVELSSNNYAVIPVENHVTGVVKETVFSFCRRKKKFRIADECFLRVHHVLAGKCELKDARYVYSMPEAHLQCREKFLRMKDMENLDLKQIPSTSTSKAAELVAEGEGGGTAVALCTMEAAQHYGLTILRKDMEDSPHNTTRFWIVTNFEAPERQDARHKRKTAFLVGLRHRAGSLSGFFQKLAESQISVLYYFPIPKRDMLPGNLWEYDLLVECEGNIHQEPLKHCYHQFQDMTRLSNGLVEKIQLLGCYPSRLSPVTGG